MATRDFQFADGRSTDVAPVGGGFGGTLWGSAGITVAWELYRQCGDWLSPVNNKNDNTLLWEAYQLFDLEVLMQSAEVLGKQQDAE